MMILEISKILSNVPPYISLYTRNGPRGPAGLGIPFAVDRMQNLVEILGQPFAENADLDPKKQECRLNPSFFQSDSACCAGLEIVDNMHKGL